MLNLLELAHRFNSNLVRLRPASNGYVETQFILFQFRHGSIKTVVGAEDAQMLIDVSISLWFNEDVPVTMSSVTVMSFQFHVGLIKTY